MRRHVGEAQPPDDSLMWLMFAHSPRVQPLPLQPQANYQSQPQPAPPRKSLGVGKFGTGAVVGRIPIPRAQNTRR
jgi:hypothetical protein